MAQQQYSGNELQIGDGLLSMEFINGWAGKGGMGGYVSMPSAITGALFLTYRHAFTRRFEVGVTAGYENLSGDLSYGNPEENQSGLDGVSGHYSVHAYTVAVEPLLAYFKRRSVMLYGYAGLGCTYFDNKFTFYPNIQYPAFFYGAPGSLVPSNPYDYHTTYFNAQVTPFGIRFGNTVAGFVEVGFGYKGLINGGLSVRF